MTLTVHVDVGGEAATITSQAGDPVAWVTDYFGPWWPAAPGPAGDGPTIEAIVDVDRYEQLEHAARTARHDEVLYARAPTWLVVELLDQERLAVTPSQRVAYHRDAEGNCSVVGTDAEKVGMALARVAREAVRARLQASGWALVHASVVVDHRDRAVLALGSKGAGKTSVGLTLATAGWRLLANDRAFARATSGGDVELLPWPAAAALGLGLLDAYDLTEAVRQRLVAGDMLHPTSDPVVPAAILSGDRSDLREPSGRERKAQFYPGQLEDWLGLRLAHTGVAHAVLHPQIALDQSPALVPDQSGVSEDDFFHGATEDRYPDILNLHAGGQPVGWTAVRSRLALLPQAGVRLGRDVAGNRTTLTEVVDQLLSAQA